MFVSVCQNLTAPENGTVTLSGNTLGETARYSCNHGYTLSDGNNRTCGHDGTWSGSDPLCLLKSNDGFVFVHKLCLEI